MKSSCTWKKEQGSKGGHLCPHGLQVHGEDTVSSEAYMRRTKCILVGSVPTLVISVVRCAVVREAEKHR